MTASSQAGPAPGVHLPETLERAPVRRDAGWSAPLRVDQRHPFFFDHPLDHVPGMLLTVGLADLVRHVAPRPHRRLRLTLEFHDFCELDAPTELTVAPGPAPVWSLRAEQAGIAVCTGSLDLGGEAAAPGLSPARHPAPEPVERHLAHRSRDDNVMIGRVAVTGRRAAAVLEPPAGHFFARRDRAHRTPEELLEAARQLYTVLCHLVARQALDRRFVWIRLRADLPAEIPRGVPLWLEWTADSPEAFGGPVSLRLRGPDPRDLSPGVVTMEATSMGPRFFQRLRDRRRGA